MDNDHKILGKKLDLFTFSDTVGKGLPLWTPKGSAIRRELERFVVDTEIAWGYQHVYTPDIAKLELYEKSGHYPYYKDSMYSPIEIGDDPIEIDNERFMLRPMSCPHHFELYLDRPRSYRELPVRYAELAKLYRYEQSGELMGLMRTRSFCLADAHIICTQDQVTGELEKVLELIAYVTKTLGLTEGTDYRFRLSLGDRGDSKKYFKDDKAWDEAEDILRGVLTKAKVEFFEASGEAAFYGPKIDIQMKNANGKEDTAFTVQYDFVMPARFKLSYIDQGGKKNQAIVIHRSSIGAIERVIAFLIEKYAGAFPVWLAPVQVKVLPITDKQLGYAAEVTAKLMSENIRVELDERNETLQAKIRDAQMEKAPYMLIIGGKEEEAGEVSVRTRGGEDRGGMDLQKFITETKNKIDSKNMEI